MLSNKSMIQTIVDFTVDDFSLSQLKELDALIDSNLSDDFYIELPNNGYEYRIITSEDIADILEESLEDLVNDCYNIDELTSSGWLSNYITIDYERMARDTHYGEHFSSYDGSEESDSDYYYFRTN